MSCAQWVEKLSGSLDGALAQDESESTEAHLVACGACRERLDALRQVKHAVARLPSREVPPGAVRARVEALLLQGRQGRRATSPWVLAASIAVIAASAFVFVRTRGHLLSADLAADLAADHLHSVPEVMPAEVATGDAGEAAQFFSGRIPFEPVVPRLEGARLLGGRLCKLEGRRLQLLFYRVDPRIADTTLSLFISDQGFGGTGCREARGLQVCGRRAGALMLLLVGQRPADEIRGLLDAASW